MEVARSRKEISISQRKYVLDLLTETGMLGCKPSDTPIKARKRTESDGKPVDRKRYQRLVVHAFTKGKSFGSSVSDPHIPKGSLGRGLFFKKSDNKKVEIYTDAVGWDQQMAKVYYRLLHLCLGNLVTWRSKKQSVVARSSAEAEFRAVAQGLISLQGTIGRYVHQRVTEIKDIVGKIEAPIVADIVARRRRWCTKEVREGYEVGVQKAIKGGWEAFKDKTGFKLHDWESEEVEVFYVRLYEHSISLGTEDIIVWLFTKKGAIKN
ncbi:hypothetical protein CK203_113924 [Vitis vinifera]|uniref:Reverse transcriptase Ty1/copia-type domain-containing protein n=1 Tax=Vitis vinifera TaxID=29760 RepID=A0A438FCP4_VITVI|nr:hypothetical protein CK203_113924 [Vitis vinifera]